MVSKKKLRIGNVICVNFENSDIVGLVIDVCYINETFKLLVNTGTPRVYCTEATIDADVSVISAIS
jgi:hypothetical protein